MFESLNGNTLGDWLQFIWQDVVVQCSLNYRVSPKQRGPFEKMLMFP